MQRFEKVIDAAVALGLRDPADPRWTQQHTELFEPPCDAAAFIEWATHHPKWLHNVADAADRVCAKPLEAAIFVLADIVDELMLDADEDSLMSGR